MAKGQKRSTKEHRKPKKDKVASTTDQPFAAQIKAAANIGRQGGAK